MLLIRELSQQIEEEMEDSRRYAELAIRHKDDQTGLAGMYMELSDAEMGHVNKLHDAVSRLIREYREKHGEPPETMQAVYDYLHDRHMDRAAEVKAIQSIYRK